MNSEDSTGDDTNIQDNTAIQFDLKDRTSVDENDDANVTHKNSSSATCSSPIHDNVTPSQKRKRHAWSIKEKLHAIEHYEKCKSKHLTAKIIGCTRYQLSEWLKMKEDLKKIQLLDKGAVLIYYVDISRIIFLFLGSQRKRLKGGGKKLKYVELVNLLIKWFKERRTPPSLETTVTTIRREKISIKQLVRQGTHFSAELKHSAPSNKWYRRFMLRHRLSLQRPKRNQKIPLSEAHKHATSFYNYLRRCSTWGPKRGPIDCSYIS